MGGRACFFLVCVVVVCVSGWPCVCERARVCVCPCDVCVCCAAGVPPVVGPPTPAPVAEDEATSSRALSAPVLLSMSEGELSRRVANILPRLERSHSWLRTVCLSRASTTLSPPIKALMELLVSFKKTVVTFPPSSISEEVHQVRGGALWCVCVHVYVYLRCT